MLFAWAPAAGAAAVPEARAVDDAAEALFRSGLRDMLAGRYEQGCPDLRESFRLDPRPGTLFTLAECEAKAGRIATAVALYGDFLTSVDGLPPSARTRHKDRVAVARTEKAALEPDVPSLTVRLAEGSAAAAIIRRDGVVLDKTTLGASTPIDPGEHTFEVEVGSSKKQQSLTIGRREQKEIVLDATLPPPAAPQPPPEVRPLAPDSRSDLEVEAGAVEPPGTVTPSQATGTRARRGVGLALAGAGGAGVLAGASALVIAWLKVRAIDDDAAAGRPYDEGNANWRRYETAGYVALGVGAALAASGAIVYWKNRDASPNPSVALRPTLGSTSAGLGISVRF
jgi:hypothetical protein